MTPATQRLAEALADVIAEAVAAATSSGEPALPPGDLTVTQLAQRFDRTASCIRSWLEAKRFANAYKLNAKDWRVPLADVLAFEAAQRAQPRAVAAVASLSDWRRTRKATPHRRRDVR